MINLELRTKFVDLEINKVSPEEVIKTIYHQEEVTCNVDLSGALKGIRKAYFRDSGGYIDCPIYDRYKLTAGSRINGPAIIEEQESTAVMSPRDSVSVDRWLNLVFKVA